MSFKTYKWCVVPHCTNTSIKTPGKLFVSVPKAIKKRNKWLQLAQRDPRTLSTTTAIYICEDHFDLPNDMENYMEYHILGSVSQVRMKPGVLPKKFECQADRSKRTATSTITRPLAIKRQKIEAMRDIEKLLEGGEAVDLQQEPEQAPIPPVNESSSAIISLPEGINEVKEVEKKSTTSSTVSHKSVQASIRITFRSKATQTI